MAFDIYSEVTDRIIAELERGIIPWNQPWTGSSDGAISYSTGRPYSLVNQFLLGKPGEYITFKQALAHGGNVRKGAKSKMVIFWKFLEKEKKTATGEIIRDKDGKPIPERIPCLKYFNVFHLDDCEGIAPRWTRETMPTNINPIDAAESAMSDYIGRSGVRLDQRISAKACYNPTFDRVTLPMMDQFTDIAEYYSVAFHELTHSTGHPSRLNRDQKNSFGDPSYAKEELVAEIGAATTLHALGVETPKSFRNNAGYIQNWLTVLRNDKRLIVTAAGRAEKAVNLMLGREAVKVE
jgi:antirestriction protein ArdC